MDRQPIGLVSRRVHERVEGGKHVGDVRAKSEEVDSIGQSRLPGTPLPYGQLGAGADDDKRRVPVPAPAENCPAPEHGVEGLATVAQGADETDERSIPTVTQRPSGGGALRGTDRSEADGIAAVVHDLHTLFSDP